MNGKRPPGTGREGGSWGPSPLWLALAVGCVAGAGAFVWTSPRTTVEEAPRLGVPAPGTAPAPAQAPAPAVVAAVPVTASATTPVAAAPAAPRIPRLRDPDGDLTPDLADYVNPGEQPTMAEVISRLHAAGVHTGLGAFQPPGTRPPLVGLAVPEDFPLPEGYVRHYQATDDGQRIEPILMFAPDREFVDAAGRPVAVPADRVVPPEMAPPGLPLRRIVVPTPRDAGR